LQQDIPNFGSHNLGTEWSFSENDVIHSIYSDKANGNPAVELEGVVESPSGTAGGFIETGEPLYSSAAKCGTSYTDFVDGYPASYGYQPYVDDDFDRSGLYTELFDALGIERAMPTGTEVLFSFISGILHETGRRLGCGCAVPTCGATEEETLLDCSLNLYLTDEGYDYNPDKVDWIPTLVADDLIGVNDNSFDNRITSMFELCPPNNQWCSLSKPIHY
jgi:hypothetical protein